MRPAAPARSRAALPWRAGALVALLALLIAPGGGVLRRALAHTYPSQIVMKVNSTAVFEVADQGTCAALVSARVADTSMATVSPAEGSGIRVPFTVTSKGIPGTTTVFVSWLGIGTDNGGGPCDEFVVDRPIELIITAEPEETSTASRPNSGVAGDPVNTYTGELYFHEAPDLRMGGPLPLQFRRYYASRMRIAFIVGDMGDNWRHEFEWRINTTGTVLQLTTATGKVCRYLKSGNVWTLQSATDLPYEVVQQGQEFLVADPRSNLLYRFAATGKLAEISDGKGNRLLLAYSGSTGRLLRVENDLPERRALVFTYQDGRVATVQEEWDGAVGRSVSFAYSGEELQSFTDAAGRVSQYVYDADHADPALLLRKVMPEGNSPWAQTYDDVGKVATQTDASGNMTSFDYGKPQTPGTTTVTRPDGRRYVHEHDGDGNLVEVRTEDGGTLVLGADGNQRRTSVRDAGGGTSTLGWNAASGRMSSFTDANGNTTSWTWASRADVATGMLQYDLARVDHPDGTSETFTYDGAGNRTSRTDEEGNTWTWTYDSRGRVLVETNPRGATTTHAYDAWGDLATVTDAAGNTDTRTYDSRRRLAAITHEDGSVQTWSRDALDRRAIVTDEDGRTWTFTHDDNGNRTSVQDALGNTVTYAYDLMDRVSSATDADGGLSSVTYDSMGRFAGKTDRRGFSCANGYDARDRMVRVTDQAGFAWTSAYDADGNLVESADPAGRTVTWERDAEGRLIRATTAAGHATVFEYDARDRVVRIVDGGDRPVEFAYDRRGLLTTADAGAGLCVAGFQHDANGLLTAIVDPNGGVWTYARDAQGRTTSRTDPLGNTTTLQFDERNRPVRHTFPGGLGTLDVSYDGVGNVTRRSFSDGLTIDHQFGADGLRTGSAEVSLQRNDRGQIVASGGLAIGRDAEGHIASVTLDAGKVVTYAYDGRGKPISVQDWAGGGVTMTWDESGRLTGLARSNGAATALTYDDDNRVVRISDGALGTIDLERDGAGLVAAAQRDLPLVPGVPDMADALLAFDAACQVDGSDYDALGRILDDGTATYTWDLASRLLSRTDDGEDVLWTYDGLGLPVSRTTEGTTDTFTWNHAFSPPVVAVQSRDGSPLRYYIHAPDGSLLYSVAAADGARRFHHYDEMGNTVFLTNDQRAVTDAWAYSPYGRVLERTGTSDQPFTWMSRSGAMEEGNGLYRMRLRVYDSVTRRFLSRDPIALQADPVAVNPYAYGRGNPLFWSDPTGQNPQASGGVDVATATGIGANLVSGFSEGLQANVPGVGQAGWTRAGQRVSNVGNVAGTAATVVGAGLEVYNTNERMNVAGERFIGAAEEIWARHRLLLAEAWRLYARKRRISYDQYTSMRRALIELREYELQTNRDRFTVDSLSIGTISTLNLLTNLIPGGGLIVDWSAHIQH